jgi:hypothetical protein
MPEVTGSNLGHRLPRQSMPEIRSSHLRNIAQRHQSLNQSSRYSYTPLSPFSLQSIHRNRSDDFIMWKCMNSLPFTAPLKLTSNEPYGCTHFLTTLHKTDCCSEPLSSCVKFVPFRYSRPQASDGGGRIPMRILAADILNKQSPRWQGVTSGSEDAPETATTHCKEKCTLLNITITNLDIIHCPVHYLKLKDRTMDNVQNCDSYINIP